MNRFLEILLGIILFPIMFIGVIISAVFWVVIFGMAYTFKLCRDIIRMIKAYRKEKKNGKY